MKWVYLLFGAIFLSVGLWFAYMIILDWGYWGYTAQIRTAGALGMCIYALICLYYFWKPQNSWVLSKLGIHLIWISVVAHILFSLGKNPFVGRGSTPLEILFSQLADLSLYGGAMLALAAMIASLFKRRPASAGNNG